MYHVPRVPNRPGRGQQKLTEKQQRDVQDHETFPVIETRHEVPGEHLEAFQGRRALWLATCQSTMRTPELPRGLAELF